MNKMNTPPPTDPILQLVHDYLDRIDKSENNIIILSAVFGATCSILLVLVIVLAYMIVELRSQVHKILYKSGQEAFSSDEMPRRRTLLGLENSVNSAPLPRLQSLTTDNLRNQDVQWNGGNNLPHLGNGNRDFRASHGGDRPFPLSQRPGNPGANNGNNFGY